MEILYFISCFSSLTHLVIFSRTGIWIPSLYLFRCLLFFLLLFGVISLSHCSKFDPLESPHNFFPKTHTNWGVSTHGNIEAVSKIIEAREQKKLEEPSPKQPKFETDEGYQAVKKTKANPKSKLKTPIISHSSTSNSLKPLNNLHASSYWKD